MLESKKETESKPSQVENLYHCLKFMVEKNMIDTYGFFNHIEKSLKENFKSTAIILFYIADEKGLNKPEWVAPVIQHIAEAKHIHSSQRISFYKGLIKLNRWKLAVSFLNYKTNLPLRTVIFNSIYWAIHDKNTKCLRELPRQGNVANRLRGYLKLDPKSWRHTLSDNTKYKLSTLMSSCYWKKIKYEKLSIYSLINNHDAFMRHDTARFKHYLHDAGTKGMEIVQSVLFPKQKQILQLPEIFSNYNKYYIKLEQKGNKHGEVTRNSSRTGSFKKADRTKTGFTQRVSPAEIQRRDASDSSNEGLHNSSTVS